MKLTDKRNVLKLMDAVRICVLAEISSHATAFPGSGTSSEGFAGGYLACLDDIDAALRHGYPSDHRGYWWKAGRAALEGAK